MGILDSLNNSYIQAKKNASEILKKRMAKVPFVEEVLKLPSRVPPHQRAVNAMVAMPPVVNSYPHIEKNEWALKLYGEVAHEKQINWEEFTKLPIKDYTVDFHCVTSWSKLDQKFSGVDLKSLFDLCSPTEKAKYVIFECIEGYTTNIPYQELKNNVGFVAIKMDGADIPDNFGGPARAVVPHLYGWKSAKHLKAIRFSEKDEPGFWEIRGYNNHGDPWKEERYN